MSRNTLKTCRYCHEEFNLLPGKPGRVNVCYQTECQTKDEKEMPEPDRLGGNMVWHHKTAPELEIKFLVEAKDFAKKTRRLGAGVTSSLTTSKEFEFCQLTHQNLRIQNVTKANTGAGKGDTYYSKVGEKRTVK